MKNKVIEPVRNEAQESVELFEAFTAEEIHDRRELFSSWGSSYDASYDLSYSFDLN